MAFKNWLQGWKRSASTATRGTRLRVETLEDRAVPATVTWDNGGGTFNWSEAANWNNNIAPVNGDTVVLIGNYTTFQDIPGLVLNQIQFTNSSAATLTLNTPLGIDGVAATNNIVNGNNGNNLITGSTLNLSGLCDIAVNGGALTIRSSIVGSAGIQKLGFNTLTMDGANSIGGGIIVQEGTLQVTGDQAQNRLPNNANVIVSSGAILEVANTNAIPNNANAIDLSLNGGSLHLSGSTNTHVHIRNLTFTGNSVGGGGAIRTVGTVSSYQNTNLFVNGNITVTGSSFLPATIDLANGLMINGNKSFSVADITGNADPDLVISATTAIRNDDAVGADSITKTGAGTMALLGASTYSGTTTISAGTLQLGNGGTSGSIGNGAITNNGAIVFNRIGDYTVTNTITGNGNLTFTQSGTKTLTNTVSLNGTITSTDGRLLLNGTVINGSANPDVTTSGAGAIGGTGTILGTTLIASGGSLLPGNFNTNGVLNTASVTFNSGSFFGLNLNGPNANDRLNVTGTVALNGATLFAIEAATVTGTITIISNDASDAINGTFAGLPEGATFTGNNGKSFRISYVGGDGNDVTLTVPGVPPVPPVPTAAHGPAFAVGGQLDGVVQTLTPTGGTYSITATFNPFPGTRTDIRTAMADVNKDGVADIIAVTGPNVPIRFSLINGATGLTLLAPTAPFTGSEGFTGGGFVSAGDIDGDGFAEIVITPDLSGGPRVTIFSMATGTLQVRANFFGIDDASFRGGARSAIGDVNNDGTADLAIVAGFGGGPRTALFNGTTLFGTPTRLINDFFAFPGSDAVTLRNGVYVAIGDVDGDRFGDLIFGGGPGGAPRLFILSGATVMAFGPGVAQSLPISNFFVAGNVADRGGVLLATADADGDNLADVVVGSGVEVAGKVRIYKSASRTGSGEPSGLQAYDIFPGAYLPGGVFVG